MKELKGNESSIGENHPGLANDSDSAYETNFNTIKTSALSNHNRADCRNLDGKEGTAVARKQTFPKKNRILKSGHFHAIRKTQMRYVSNLLLIGYRLGKSTTPKLGLTVSKKRIAKAVSRNRFKRVVREGFRKTMAQFPVDIELNVIPRSIPDHLSSADVEKELRIFLNYLKRNQRSALKRS